MNSIVIIFVDIHYILLMMYINLYWTTFRSLERECLEIAENIHFDDRQLNTYSIKIANLLVYTCIEIESISKDLYMREAGTDAKSGNLYFDTDCLAFLDKKWSLSKKHIIVSNPTFEFKDENNICLRPLHKAHKSGNKTSDWKKAYQAVKHNRSESLYLGNLRHLIRSMAALYLLNIYYSNQVFPLGCDANGKSFDSTLGSSMFSVEYQECIYNAGDETYSRSDNYDNCVYLMQPTENTKHIFEISAKKIMEEILDPAGEETRKTILTDTEKLLSLPKEDVQLIINKTYENAKEKLYKRITPNDQLFYKKALRIIEYEMILNVNQL